ncbi:redox-regulated ATPase YchF [Chloroflexota bacterium]
MDLAIIGLPQSGKTALFNALARSRAEGAPRATGAPAPSLGVVPVPEPRLQVLIGMFQPKKVVHATVKYVDLPAAPQDFGKGSGIAGPFLSELSKADALLMLVRSFQDDRVPHFEGSVDPARDLATLTLEMAFSDMAIIERRKLKIAGSLKGARAGEREAYRHEEALLDRIKASLEAEVPLREQSLTLEEARIISGYRFLTAKPLMVVLNIDESRLPQAAVLEKEYNARYARDKVQFIALCCKLEMELAELGEEEAAEFRRALCLAETPLDRLVQLSYRLLGLLFFFTVGSDEVKAWTVARGTSALKAAGKIHTDIEKGFIRAEVVSFADLVKCGSLAEARRQGVLRLEGKSYSVQDGDIITYLFNV